jgi:hypothetical protein
MLPCIHGVGFPNEVFFYNVSSFCGRMSVVKLTERQTSHWSVTKDFSVCIIN